jgi:hypothetical protein
MRTVEAEYLLNITDVIGDRNLVTLSATASPEPVITFLSSETTLTYRNRNGSTLRTAKKPIRFHVHQWTPDWQNTTSLEETYRNYHCVESVEKDEYLLVCGRAANDQEHNAFIYGSQGQLIRSFPVGDAVASAQASRAGNRIWVSYFDEGFGEPFSEEGVMSFETDGAPAFRFLSDVVNRPPYFVPQIFDCYAMNVAADNDVWLYYYTEFPLVRLHQGHVKHVWENLPFSGSHAFSVTDDRVLFSGGYNEADRLYIVPLYQRPENTETIVPVDANGDTIIATHHLFARDSRMYFLRENDLFVLDLHIHF